jgi:antitoxin component of MazEF toxin-antitoxin module
MQSRIQAVGNTLSVQIPEAIFNALHLKSDSTVELRIAGEGIEIATADARQRELAELVSRITDENRHPETYMGN